MSEDTTTAPAQAAPEQPAAAAQQAAEPARPQIDVAALQAQMQEQINSGVAEGVKRATGDIRTSLRQALGEEPAKPEPHVLHTEFVKDPAALLRNLKDLSKEEAKAEIVAEQRRQNQNLAVLNKFKDDYPDVDKFRNEVNADFAAMWDANGTMSEAEVLEKSIPKTIERLGLKKVSEEERQAQLRAARLPGGAAGAGYFPQGAPSHNPEKSSMDAIQAMREQGMAFRTRLVQKS